jgi:steroid 5-alpha reductase family enzyme
MHGENEESTLQKIFLTIIHLLSVLAAGWILFGNGMTIISDWFNTAWKVGDYYRRVIILSFSIIYFIRLNFTTFYLTRRKIGWEEVIPVSLLLILCHIGFSILGGVKAISLGIIDFMSIILYLFGSYLNTGSELMRHKWKQKPENMDRIYTEGLFKWSMHINYFGDTVLFFAFALITRSIWAFIIPFVMTMGFIFIHIPILDKYLEEKYGTQFDDYAKRTKKFIPFIY